MNTKALPCRDYFRHRAIGRAASPPTWACYEQIRYDDDYSDESCSDSCSEDDEDYGRAGNVENSDSENDDDDDDDHVAHTSEAHSDDAHDDIDMDMGMDGELKESVAAKKADVKGKQKAVEAVPDPEPHVQDGGRAKQRRNQRRRPQRPAHQLRPILTIHRSQGFVWNQDLFIPPYIKDRYIASSPPNSSGFASASVSSTNSALSDYDAVDVVEIRVQEGELKRIIP